MNVIRVGIDTPRIEYEKGLPGLTARRRGILAAMLEAVQRAKPGDLIIQEDIEVNASDRFLEDIRLHPGTIVTLNPEREPGHTCPQAFIIADEPTRQLLITAWSRPDIQSCMSWQSIPKIRIDVPGTHAGRPWRRTQ